MNHRDYRVKSDRPSSSTESGILSEEVLVLVFESINWDPQLLCLTSCISRGLRALAKRLLWRHHCVSRAPKMVSALANSAPTGDWLALAKLLCYCCGCVPNRNFRVNRVQPGHLAKETRFSKTSGKSFLTRTCREDTLYISDPCEHAVEDSEDYLGVYRGVFRGFGRSRTRECLIRRQVELEQQIRCPYCGERVWSMTSARLVPRSASRRLGTNEEGSLEYFVCLNGHLHGSCWLVPLSSDEDEGGNLEDDDDDDDADEGGARGSDEEVGRSVRENGGWLG
ncbi:hypothetical protein Syun_007643 [Stephania yunnanensis]|uniref:EID1-like F-box protein 3 n=1 Tax=Stephania yunnanensis TaxID=152371 RepID=A0AAP0PYQ0_9MAGN